MVSSDLRKGLINGIICVVLIGLQPIVSLSRPSIIDAFTFSTLTVMFMAIIFFPLFLIERYRLITLNKKEANIRFIILLNGWKKKRNIKLLIGIGIVFAIVPVLLIIGYDLAGAVNSSLALKSEVIFALLFGYMFLNEKQITKMQILFCIILFLGLLIAITQGFFNLLEFNLGVLIILLAVAIFTITHTFTKSGFDRNEISPIQVVFIRNVLSGILLMSTYLIFFPIEGLILVFSPQYLIFPFIMGVDWGFSLYFWYRTLSYIEIGKAGVIMSLTPITSTFFSWIILGDDITHFHLIGITIVIISIYMIVREHKGKNQ
ncbi:MAG: DMT family transporter [Candidatus Lokiarchaeota archaeon]|nr:DMT family transporter [Candidatus Lokiarchaeota archaeon]